MKSVSDPFSREDFSKLTQKGQNNLDSTATTVNGSGIGLIQNSKYARLPNGMIINHDVSELKRQNDMLAKINAYVAKGKAKNGEL